MPSPLDILHSTTSFIKTNLATCCRELVEFRRTGVLPSGRVREAATMLTYVPGSQRLTVAQSIVTAAALEQVASV